MLRQDFYWHHILTSRKRIDFEGERNDEEQKEEQASNTIDSIIKL